MATNMLARIGQLYRTEAEWNKLSTFVPEEGELVLYAPDENFSYARAKVGDGSTKLSELDFFIESAAEAVFSKLAFSNIVDGGRIK
jgi:hypothetical protein